jgi:peptidoglycan/LPS O-acetylase OafA/YrhL
MRAVAVLAVLLVHSAAAARAEGPSLAGRLVAHMNVGVTIFFVISGFLLYRPFISSRTGGAAPPRVADYAKRRVLRIYPAYWLALTALTLAPGVTGVFDGHWLGQYGLVQTLPFASTPTCTEAPLQCGLAQTWSLVAEATFYLLLPMYVVLANRLASGRRGSRWIPRELVVLAALSALFTAIEFSGERGELVDWISRSAPGYALWFGLGMGLAILSVGAHANRTAGAFVRRLARRPMVPWLMAGAIYLALSLWLPPSAFVFERGQQIVTHVAFGLIAALLVIPAVFPGERPNGPARLLANPVVAWLGLISYGIFLWHYVFTIKLGYAGSALSFPVILAITLAGSTCLAALSYYLVERPILRLKYRRILPRRAPEPSPRP